VNRDDPNAIGAGVVRQWIAAAERPQIARAIDDLHTEIERAVEAAAPRCEQSGRCCRFEQYGHRLYVTGLEAALVVERELASITTKKQPIDSKSQEALSPSLMDKCPFQIGKTCGVHANRPAGCRIYFCDERWAPMMTGVAERAVGRVREMHRAFDVPYRYMEWRALLELIAPEVGGLKAITRGFGGGRIDVTIEGKEFST